jgi:hypothetical protein
LKPSRGLLARLKVLACGGLRLFMGIMAALFECSGSRSILYTPRPGDAASPKPDRNDKIKTAHPVG